MSVNADQAFLHEAPSGSTKKSYIVTKGYPLEVIVSLKEWKKVNEFKTFFFTKILPHFYMFGIFIIKF